MDAEEPSRLPAPPPGPPDPQPPRQLLVPLAGLLFLAAAILLSVGRSCTHPPSHLPEAPHASTRQEIREFLEAGVGGLTIADTAGAESTWRWVKAFYAQRGGSAAWSGRVPHHRAEQLVAAIERIGEAGL